MNYLVRNYRFKYSSILNSPCILTAQVEDVLRFLKRSFRAPLSSMLSDGASEGASG